MHALGIDVGSTNVKVALVDAEGDLVADASRPLRTDHAGDQVTQSADAVWEAVVDATCEVTAAQPDAAATVTSIGVCSQYSSIVPVDGDGAPAGPLITYMDQRGTARCWDLMEQHPDAFTTWVERHGIPPIGGGLSLAHLLHLQHDQPEVHARTAAWLEVMDFVNLRLTGRVAANQCTMFASQLCDNRSVGSTAYDPELVRLSGLDADRLPPLIGLGDVVGELVASVAQRLGLPAGIPVMAGMNDTQAGAFATGTTGALGTSAAGHGRCGLVVGTTAVLVRPLDSMSVDLEHEVLSMPAPIDGHYVVMAENGIAGRAVDHASSLLSPGVASADRFEELGAALTVSAPGAGGVLFLPWLAGSMSPSSAPAMRGGFVGMSVSTTREDLLRALVEGVARNLRWLMPAVDGLVGTPARTVVFAGGAARSRGWAQVTADVLGHPVEVLDRPEVAAARAVGMVALRRASGADPTDVRIPVCDHLEPDPSAVAVNDRLQPEFEALFTAVRPVCEALAP